MRSFGRVANRISIFWICCDRINAVDQSHKLGSILNDRI